MAVQPPDSPKKAPKHSDLDKEGLGIRLKAARTTANLTLAGAAERLTAAGYPCGRGTVGAWEDGRNIPDALVLRRLAKAYGVSADALLWDDSLTMEAIRFAALYDALDERQQRTFKAMWLAYFEQAKADHHVEDSYGLPPTAIPSPPPVPSPSEMRAPAPSRYVKTDKPGSVAAKKATATKR